MYWLFFFLNYFMCLSISPFLFSNSYLMLLYLLILFLCYPLLFPWVFFLYFYVECTIYALLFFLVLVREIWLWFFLEQILWHFTTLFTQFSVSGCCDDLAILFLIFSVVWELFSIKCFFFNSNGWEIWFLPLLYISRCSIVVRNYGQLHV
jgi:hypothetical protein